MRPCPVKEVLSAPGARHCTWATVYEGVACVMKEFQLDSTPNICVFLRKVKFHVRLRLVKDAS